MNSLLSSVCNSKKTRKLTELCENMDTDDVYQIYGMLLKDTSEKKDTFYQVKKGRIGWNSPIYDKVREQIQEQENYLINPIEVAEGVSTCPKCQSNKTFSVQKQVRSSDEPMTTFLRCVRCSYTWTYSG